jgi:hypothetical protein
MPENYALYTRSYDTLPQANMEALAGDAALEKAQTERGVTYTYRWPDLTIIVNEMPASQLEEHLRGFEGYISQHIYKGKVPSRGKDIIRNIWSTRLVVGVEFQPGPDKQGHAEELLGRMSGGLHPIIFHADALFDWTSRLLLAPDGSFDPAAEIRRPWWKFW